MRRRLPFAVLTLLAFAHPAHASELRDASPVTDRVIALTFVDGKAVRETQAGAYDGHVDGVPLDTAKAAQPTSYEVASPDDPAYRSTAHPARVGRKSKGGQFVNNRGKSEWVMTHRIYLLLSAPLTRGKTYRIGVGSLSTGQTTVTLVFDERKLRSEAVHVNELGYVPAAPRKLAYLSAWLGDAGPLSLDDYAGARFHVIDRKTGRDALSGQPVLRKRATQPDTGQAADGPNANFTGADVWEMDFSALKAPGDYLLSVDRIGCSYPFSLDADVYRKAFITTIRGLYHQRCGVELKEPYTDWTRPACHRPETRPFLATTDRYIDTPHDDGDPKADAKTTGEKRLVWGGWHDAGDWDREPWHIGVSDTLLLAYELAPTHFKDGEQNIPESGNGIPDIVDEARWGVDYYRRIQRPEGGVSVGFYESSYPKPGETAWTDKMGWYMYAEDPVQTYRYAAAACRLAWCLKLAGKPALAAPYVESARRAWTWAQANTKPGDEKKVRDERLHAAAALFKATGEPTFEAAFKKDLLVGKPDTLLDIWDQYDQRWGVWTYVTTSQPGMDTALKERLRQASIHEAQVEDVDNAEKRGFRIACNWYIPVAWGMATSPRMAPLMVAHYLTKEPRFLDAQYTTCNFMLGGNPMNMVWVTGLGPNHPHEVMQWDSWYHPLWYKTGESVPGIVPMGPTHYIANRAAGPWDPGWAQQQACYPDAKQWPPMELWFEDRYCPPTNEFTVGTIADAAAAYGYLCGEAR